MLLGFRIKKKQYQERKLKGDYLLSVNAKQIYICIKIAYIYSIDPIFISIDL